MYLQLNLDENNLHWNYFLALESDLARASRFIEFHKDNYNVYSIEFARLLFAASSEVEIVGKDICHLLGEKLPKRANIGHIRNGLGQLIPSLSLEYISIPKYGLTLLSPFKEFETGGVPDWWDSYNAVKHSRHAEFKQATLRNALFSLAGLAIIILYRQMVKDRLPIFAMCRAVQKLKPEPKLFRFMDNHYFDNLKVF